MDIWATDKLVLFLVFVIPGFLSLKTYAMLGLRAPRDSSQQLVDAIAFSCINYALLAWPILMVESSDWRNQYPRGYVAFYAAVVLVAPVLWGLVWMLLRKTNLAQRFLPHPLEKPWDFVFGQRRHYWIIATLRDGRKIAGKYAGGSFSSAAPAPEQLYLEEAWKLNEGGGFERALIDTAGVLILGPDIASIEFFHVREGEANGDKPYTEGPGD
ncbi:DUF6338 family protein [Variovorax ginsengisoli]|uniref:DUF6338 family protein n=1 Tax=Variovorax ginsengisoli TaxID=363844 RepID=A0ABT8SBL6_9BURK|nr:DUF6338 family protein [Variovorax ginsengisoli]MDN8617139.1 DUF6338 family protein [Variovorax ginsengisoli]MDO1536309.1 DUF6338 family protein [Variovorax ginsengisoli]